MTLGLLISAAVEHVREDDAAADHSRHVPGHPDRRGVRAGREGGLEQISCAGPVPVGLRGDRVDLEPERDPAAGRAHDARPRRAKPPARASTRASKHHNGKGGNTPSASAAPGGAAPPAGSTPSSAPRAAAHPEHHAHHHTARPRRAPRRPGRARRRRRRSAPPRPRPGAGGSLAATPKKSGAIASPSGTTTSPASNPRPRPRTAGSSPIRCGTTTPNTWLKDMAAMVVLSLLFTALAWWRLLKLSPGRRK